MKIREIIVENSMSDVVTRAKRAIDDAMSNTIFSKAVSAAKKHQTELAEIKKQLEQMSSISKKDVISLVTPLATKVAEEIKPTLNEDFDGEDGIYLGAWVGGLLGVIIGAMKYGFVGFFVGPLVGVVSCSVIFSLIGSARENARREEMLKSNQESNRKRIEWERANPEAHAANLRRLEREQRERNELLLQQEFEWLDNQPEWNLTRAQKRRHDELANYLGVRE